MRPELISLFREVADLAPDARQEHYTREKTPAALRDEVESLLSYDASSDSLRDCVDSVERRLLDQATSPHAPAPTQSRPVPSRIGRFEVERLLGRGGMGDVYLARDPVIERPVAVKLIGRDTDDDASRRRLVREARTAGRLQHPNIVTIFEAGEHDGRSYIAMEFIRGETLGALIRRREPLSLRRRLELMEGACAGLAHAHRAGIVHLDIKPDNLMLDETGVLKVLDFGISRVLHGDSLATAHLAGTLRYMSPEQIHGKGLDHRSDVFSLGCSLFELVTYTPAFDGSTRQIVDRIAQGPIPRLLERSPSLDAALERIVGKAMALEPAKRYSDLDELRADLARARARIDPEHDGTLASPPLGVAAVPFSSETDSDAAVARSRRRSRLAAPALGVGLGVVALTATTIVWWNGPAADVARTATPVVTDATTAAASDAPPSVPPRETVPPPAPAAGQKTPEITRAGAQPPASTEAPGGGASAAILPTIPNISAPDTTAVPAPPADGRSSEPVMTEGPASLPSTVPLPSPVVPTVAERPAVANTPPPAPSDSELIRDTLRRYDAAFVRMDLTALLAVYPSLGPREIERYRRTFADNSAYNSDTRPNRIEVNGDRATVHAVVARRIVPRVGGNRVQHEQPTEFQLERNGPRWVIVAVTPR